MRVADLVDVLSMGKSSSSFLFWKKSKILKCTSKRKKTDSGQGRTG